MERADKLLFESFVLAEPDKRGKRKNNPMFFRMCIANVFSPPLSDQKSCHHIFNSFLVVFSPSAVLCMVVAIFMLSGVSKLNSARYTGHGPVDN